MLILTENNTAVAVENIHQPHFYFSTLSFQEYRNPDFIFRKESTIEEYESPMFEVQIGDFRTIVPFHWGILCSDHEYIQFLPFREISYGHLQVFCLNPIDGYAPFYLPLKFIDIHPKSTWVAPALHERDLLVMPLGTVERVDKVSRGPLCCMVGASTMDILRPISDIW